MVQGELQHKMIKRRFPRTNKRNFTSQLATAEVRERFMRHITQRITYRARLSQIKVHRKRRQKRAQSETEEGNTADLLNPTQRRYDIADSSKEVVNILEWVHSNRADVAMKVRHTKYYRRTY